MIFIFLAIIFFCAAVYFVVKPFFHKENIDKWVMRKISVRDKKIRIISTKIVSHDKD